VSLDTAPTIDKPLPYESAGYQAAVFSSNLPNKRRCEIIDQPVLGVDFVIGLLFALKLIIRERDNVKALAAKQKAMVALHHLNFLIRQWSLVVFQNRQRNLSRPDVFDLLVYIVIHVMFLSQLPLRQERGIA
jgi:hypothetical protein